MVFIHFAGELRVPDYVAVTIEDEEIGTPDDYDGASADCGFTFEFRLVNHGNAVPDGFQSSSNPLVSLNNTDVLVSTKRGEMLLLVNAA
jgi:hypothetical protein